MKFGIITLVSDNYGNKYQNYAVEQLLSQYGEVETFSLEPLYNKKNAAVRKLTLRYIKEALAAKLMYKYDITCVDKGVLYNLLYAKKNSKKLVQLRKERFRHPSSILH